MGLRVHTTKCAGPAACSACTQSESALKTRACRSCETGTREQAITMGVTERGQITVGVTEQHGVEEQDEEEKLSTKQGVVHILFWVTTF